MSFFDLINELQTKGQPEKAARAMKILALICVVGGIWNYGFIVPAPVNRMPVTIHPDFPATALVLLIVTIIIACYSIFSGFNSTVPIPPAPILIIFSVLFIARFVVPAYFGIQYLGRLPVNENSTAVFVSCTGSSGTNGIKSSNSSNSNTGRLLKPAPKETVCGKMA